MFDLEIIFRWLLLFFFCFLALNMLGSNAFTLRAIDFNASRARLRLLSFPSSRFSSALFFHFQIFCMPKYVYRSFFFSISQVYGCTVSPCCAGLAAKTKTFFHCIEHTELLFTFFLYWCYCYYFYDLFLCCIWATAQHAIILFY